MQNRVSHWRVDLLNTAADLSFHSLSNSITMATTNINTGHTRLETSDSGLEVSGVGLEMMFFLSRMNVSV